MKTIFRVWLAAMSLAGGLACGDDGDASAAGESHKDAGSKSGESVVGIKSEQSGAGSRGGAGMIANGVAPSGVPGGVASVACGSKSCVAPGGGFASPCCVDSETETCGMSFMGAGCSAPEPGDERCPSLMGFVTLPSCCTPEGMCGISAAMFGMPGCIELSEAVSRAQMSSASSFPAPRSCDGASSAADGDAGLAGEDGGA